MVVLLVPLLVGYIGCVLSVRVKDFVWWAPYAYFTLSLFSTSFWMWHLRRPVASLVRDSIAFDLAYYVGYTVALGLVAGVGARQLFGYVLAAIGLALASRA